MYNLKAKAYWEVGENLLEKLDKLMTDKQGKLRESL